MFMVRQVTASCDDYDEYNYSQESLDGTGEFLFVKKFRCFSDKRFDSDFEKEQSAQNYPTTNFFLCLSHDGLLAKMGFKF